MYGSVVECINAILKQSSYTLASFEWMGRFRKRQAQQVASKLKIPEIMFESMTVLLISAIEPDWSRERICRWWDPSRQLLKSIRGYQKWQARGGIIGHFLDAFNVMQYRFWSVVTGADIPLSCQIEGGLLLPHPNGVVIHPAASIGPNCLIFQQVTIVEGVKTGGHVDIGAGAKIIGAVSIGDHAKIAANAVVLRDVLTGATAVRVPAKIISTQAGEKA